MHSAKRPSAAVVLSIMMGCCIGGCASDDIPTGQPFIYNGNSWRVSDARGEGHLVIVAVDPRLAGLGTQSDIRHPVDPMPEAEYRAAATGWFTTTGRFCSPGNGEDAQRGYQYNYSCWTPP